MAYYETINRPQKTLFWSNTTLDAIKNNEVTLWVSADWPLTHGLQIAA
jgi:hypothetical protein